MERVARTDGLPTWLGVYATHYDAGGPRKRLCRAWTWWALTGLGGRRNPWQRTGGDGAALAYGVGWECLRGGPALRIHVSLEYAYIVAIKVKKVKGVVTLLARHGGNG